MATWVEGLVQHRVGMWQEAKLSGWLAHGWHLSSGWREQGASTGVSAGPKGQREAQSQSRRPTWGRRKTTGAFTDENVSCKSTVAEYDRVTWNLTPCRRPAEPGSSCGSSFNSQLHLGFSHTQCIASTQVAEGCSACSQCPRPSSTALVLRYHQWWQGHFRSDHNVGEEVGL